MFTLVPSDQYVDELREIEADAGYLAERLSGVYRILERDPWYGHESVRHGLWVIRQTILPGLLVVQIAYRIEERAHRVDLVSIRAIDLTTL